MQTIQVKNPILSYTINYDPETLKGTLQFESIHDIIRGSEDHVLHGRYTVQSLSEPQLNYEDCYIFLPGEETQRDGEILHLDSETFRPREVHEALLRYINHWIKKWRWKEIIPFDQRCSLRISVYKDREGEKYDFAIFDDLVLKTDLCGDVLTQKVLKEGLVIVRDDANQMLEYFCKEKELIEAKVLDYFKNESDLPSSHNYRKVKAFIETLERLLSS